jgi:P pilus assembly chaperone PapD
MFIRASWLACLVLGAAFAHGAMRVDRNVVTFEPGSPGRADVEVQNPDAEPLYAEVEVFEVQKPGADDEVRVKVTDPAQVHFLVTPSKFVVAPGARKVLRLVNLGSHGDVERVYRINVRPVPAPVEAKASGIRLLVAYQLLVIVSPAVPKPNLVVSRSGNTLIAENRGNVNALMSAGVQCETADALQNPDPSICTALETHRVYPGNTWTLTLPGDGPVEFTVSHGAEHHRNRY